MTANEAPLPTPHRVARGALLKSLLKVISDPNETSHGARLVMHFDRKNMEENYADFAAHPLGRRILDGAPSLFDLLTDRESLSQLPKGSVGRTYLDYMIQEEISTEALDEEVLPIELEVFGSHPDRRRFHQHMRASHDLWHVLTGYHRDLFGEVQLLTFSHYQTGSPSFKWLSRLARFGIGRRVPGGLDLLKLAKRRGLETTPLFTVDWTSLLGRPIDEVREQLHLGPPPSYTRYVRSPEGFGLVPEAG